MNKQESSTDLQSIKTLEDKLALVISDSEKIELTYNLDENILNEIKIFEDEKAIIKAHCNYPKVVQYPSLALKYKLLIAINKTILFVGYNVKDIDFLYRGVHDYVKNEAKHITVEELEIAFKRGAMDEYGEWQGLSAMTFCKWIKSYMTITRIEALKHMQKIRDRENRVAELTPQEKITSRLNWLKGVLVEYDSYYKNSSELIEYTDYGGYLYNLLYRLNLLEYTQFERDKFKREARLLLKQQSKSNMKVDEDLVVIRAKHLVIIDWLKNAKIKQVNLAELIEERGGWELIKREDYV